MRKRLPLLCIVLIGLSLCAANVAVTLQRTAIPRGIDGRVTALGILREKHPGVDDVLFVTIDDRPMFQVEYTLFNLLELGDDVAKAAWSASITVNGVQREIPWSADFPGMAVLMAIAGGGVLLLAAFACRGKPI